jgi:hypothetical protein
MSGWREPASVMAAADRPGHPGPGGARRACYDVRNVRAVLSLHSTGSQDDEDLHFL